MARYSADTGYNKMNYMKKILLITVFISAAAVFNNASAQIRFGININIGSQPDWGPVGYDRADYYYMPDIQTYYYVPTRKFIYLSGGNWVFSYNLPPAYRNYNLYTGYKVVVNEPRAYQNYRSHRVQYSRYRNDRSQVIIRNSHEPKYQRNNHYNGNRNGNRNDNRNRKH